MQACGWMMQVNQLLKICIQNKIWGVRVWGVEVLMCFVFEYLDCSAEEQHEFLIFVLVDF